MKLHQTLDGSHLREAHRVPFSHRWVRGMPYLSGKDYLNLLKIRINGLPTRARLARGRAHYARTCRHGCDKVETLVHVSQLCDAMNRNIIKRHDGLCKVVARELKRAGLEVRQELLCREPGKPGLKPDLVVTTPQAVWALDAEICGTNLQLELARRDKIAKYDVDWLKSRLPHPERPRRIGSITVSMAGHGSQTPSATSCSSAYGRGSFSKSPSRFSRECAGSFAPTRITRVGHDALPAMEDETVRVGFSL